MACCVALGLFITLLRWLWLRLTFRQAPPPVLFAPIARRGEPGQPPLPVPAPVAPPPPGAGLPIRSLPPCISPAWSGSCWASPTCTFSTCS